MRRLSRRSAIRRLRLAVVLAPLWLVGGLARADEERTALEISAYEGVLPAKDPEFDREVEATVVVDAATGAPVVGAWVRAYAEVVDEQAPRFAPLVGQARTDTFGVAWIRLASGFHADHWVVGARGYEPVYSYGHSPDARIRLRPAVPVAVRILDAWGRPVAGADVEAWHGCPHAPAVLAGTTDQVGACRWDAGGGSPWFLWVRAPGSLRMCYDLEEALVEPETVVLEPGFTLRGRLRDEEGVPIHGATVRGMDYPRGPATLTDRDGRFVLHGVGPSETIRVLHPTVTLEEGRHDVDRVVDGVDLDLRWRFDGFVEAAGTSRVTLRFLDPTGAGIEGCQFLVIGPDGRASRDAAAADGVATLDLAPGTYRLRPASPFDEHAFAEATVALRAGEERTVDVVGWRRARLRLLGDVPEGGVGLVVPGRTTWAHLDDDDGKPVTTWLPAVGPAAVRWGRWWFPVGPSVNGVRTATVHRPRPHRLRLAAPGEIGDVGLSAPGRAWPMRLLSEEETKGGVVTVWEGGRVWLHVEHSDPPVRRRIPLDLPPVDFGGVERTIDVEKEAVRLPPAGPVMLTVTRPDGSPVVAVDVEADELRGTNAIAFTGGFDESPMEIPGIGRVWVWAPGLQPLRVDLDRPGEHQAVFPAGTIDVVVTRASGGPRPTRALLDGAFHDLDESGRLVVSGLSAGPHALVVTHLRGGGIVWRFTLAEGERREASLRLP